MADELAKKRVAAFTIAIAKALGRPVEEIRTMARGALLNDLDSDSIPFTDAAEIVAAQHESYDGTGFPKGLKGDEIPLGARVLRVADALHGLIAGLPPRHAVSITEAKQEIRQASGTLFDPKVVNSFVAMPESIWADLIQETSKNE